MPVTAETKVQSFSRESRNQTILKLKPQGLAQRYLQAAHQSGRKEQRLSIWPSPGLTRVRGTHVDLLSSTVRPRFVHARFHRRVHGRTRIPLHTPEECPSEKLSRGIRRTSHMRCLPISSDATSVLLHRKEYEVCLQQRYLHVYVYMYT